MRLYSKQDLLQALPVNHHRLDQMLEDCHIIPQPTPYDQRLRVITEDEYKKLKAYYLAGVEALGESAPDIVMQQQAQIDALQRENSRLKAQIPDSTSSPTEATPAPRVRVRSGFTAQHVDVPAGWEYTEAFAKAHGVPKATAWGHVTAGKFTETTQPIPNRKDKHHFLTPEQQEAAIMYWRAHYSGYRACGDPACPCQTV